MSELDIKQISSYVPSRDIQSSIFSKKIIEMSSQLEKERIAKRKLEERIHMLKNKIQ